MKPFIHFVLLSCLPLAARADGNAVADAGGSLLQLALGLLVVLAMLGVGVWVLKRLSLPHGAASRLMRVVAGTPVGPRERVVLLEIGSTWLVLGVAPGRVSALAEVPRQELPPTTAATPEMDFAGWLKHIVERRHGPSGN